MLRGQLIYTTLSLHTSLSSILSVTMGAATVMTPAGKCVVLGQEEYVSDSWLKAAYATEK